MNKRPFNFSRLRCKDDQASDGLSETKHTSHGSSPLSLLVHCATMLLAVFLVTAASTATAFQPLVYRIGEDHERGSVIADIKRDSHLAALYNRTIVDRLTFVFLDLESRGDHPHHPQRFFRLDGSSGLIRTRTNEDGGNRARLDRDELCPRATACDLRADIAVRHPATSSIFHVVKVIFEVVDVNDNAPRFSADRIQLNVSEATAPGDLVALTGADDSDSPRYGVVRYGIRSEVVVDAEPAASPSKSCSQTAAAAANSTFDLRIDDNDDDADVDGSAVRDLRLVLVERLDHERCDRYRVTVTAHDGGVPSRSGAVTIDVRVLDANDHRPELDAAVYETAIVENAPPSASLVAIGATDRDATAENARIVYRLSARSADAYGRWFGVDAGTGVVYQRRAVDYEHFRSDLIVLDVDVTDGGEGAMPVVATVLVSVSNLNDNPPTVRVEASSFGVDLTSGDGGAAFVTADDEPEAGSNNNINNTLRVTENCCDGVVIGQAYVSDLDTADDAGRSQCRLLQNGVFAISFEENHALYKLS